MRNIRYQELRERVVELKHWAEDRNDVISQGRVQGYNSVLALLNQREQAIAAAPPLRCEFEWLGKRCVLALGHADDGPNKCDHELEGDSAQPEPRYQVLREAILNLKEHRISSGNSTWYDCEPLVYLRKHDVLAALAAAEPRGTTAGGANEAGT